MSIRIMTEVWADAPVKGSTLLVALALADCANDDHRQAWPGIENLAQKARVSPRQVKYCIAELAEKNIIEIQKNCSPQRTNLYTITDVSGWLEGANSALSNGKGAMQRNGAEGANSASEGAMGFPSNGQPTSPKPLENRKEPSLKEKSTKKEKFSPVKTLAQVIDEDMAVELLKLRQKKKAPETERAINSLVKNLSQFKSPNEAAEKMLLKGWLSIERDWSHGLTLANVKPSKRVQEWREQYDKERGWV